MAARLAQLGLGRLGLNPYPVWQFIPAMAEDRLENPLFY